MLHDALLPVILLAAAAAGSSFDGYSVDLEPSPMPGACALEDPSRFENGTYRFSGHATHPFDKGQLTLRDGTSTQRDLLGSPEWVTSLTHQRALRLGEIPAVLLVFFSDHVGGTGSATHLPVVRCRGERLQAVFEASGEGIDPSPETGYSYSARDGLRVTHAVWLPSDSHADPSREVEERYRWRAATGRFVLHEKRQRERRKNHGGAERDDRRRGAA